MMLVPQLYPQEPVACKLHPT
ncbi:hypothetical protein OF001_U190028 [Pseudomonas sp. OF001]|nr:hypothetical protein OF001_U190028 [Pseudomonas sp. OF001]